MKIFSDLRLSSAQVTEQFTALILAGVAAVVIGGVAHVSAHRNQVALPQAEFFAADMAGNDSLGSPIVMDGGVADASEAVSAEAEPEMVAGVERIGEITPLSLAPVVSPLVQQAVVAVTQAVARPEHVVRTAEIGRNRSLTSLLVAEADLDAPEVAAITKALATVHKDRLSRGVEVSMRFTQLGDDETLDSLTFQPTVTTEVRINRLADGSYKAEKVNTPLERQRKAVEGTIRTSLIESGVSRGVPRNVMSSMVRAFSHDVDFQRDIHPGDKFRVLYDQPRAKNGQPVGDATIIYAAIETAGVKKAIYRVIYSDGTAEYFNDRGEGVKRGLMRTPIDGAHMTSGYGMRRHPILGYSKFHQGVDFAAPTGTPIFAAGDGVVEEAEFQGGYGRFVLIRHRNDLSTAYGHMSRFARGLKPGDKVSQGDVIGYVGSTGRSTGPHLHFEVRVNGNAINPLNVNMQARNRLSGRSLAQFNAGKLVIETEFKRRSLAVNDGEAKPVKLAAKTRGAAAQE